MAYIGECINRNVSTIVHSQTVCQYEMYFGGCMTNSLQLRGLLLTGLVLTKTGHRVQCRRQKREEKRDRTAATETERKSVVGGTSICSNLLILSPPSHLPLSFHAISFLHGVSFSSCPPHYLSLATRHSPFFSSPRPWVFLKGARNFAYETAKREKVRAGGTSSDIGSFNYFELARSIDTMKYGSPRITNYDTLISYWSAIDAECW